MIKLEKWNRAIDQCFSCGKKQYSPLGDKRDFYCINGAGNKIVLCKSCLQELLVQVDLTMLCDAIADHKKKGDNYEGF